MLEGVTLTPPTRPPSRKAATAIARPPKPNQICPECDGLGKPFAVFADTRNHPPDAALLFEGVKETYDGIPFIMASKQASFDILAKHYGLMTEKIEHTGKDGKPIQHHVNARVIIVPAKLPSPITVRSMQRADREWVR